MPNVDVIIFNGSDLLSRHDPHQRCSDYLSQLEIENQKVNLVSRETGRAGLIALYAESLIPLELFSLRKFSRYLDIGSGGGFPAFPILLSGTVGQATLIERIQKKAAALQRISLNLGLKPEIRSENFGQAALSGPFDLITLRLVKLDRKLLRAIEANLLPEGLFVYFSSYESADVPANLNCQLHRYQMDDQTPTKSLTIFKKPPQ